MRRILIIVALAQIAVQAVAADAGRDPAPLQERRAGVDWVRPAPASFALMSEGLIEANLAAETGVRPIVLLETNYYTYLAGEPLELRLTMDPNGFGGPVTLYLFRENRETGERFYYTTGAGELAANVQADLFGGADTTPAPVFVPTLSDFVLFGSATPSHALSWGINGALGAARSVPSGQTGLYQWVVEVRDVAGKRVISRSNAMYSYVTSQVEVTGKITSSTTWTPDKRYVLRDYVGVVEPAVLTILPGTVVYGGNGDATLFIQAGAKIMADGTGRRPIIFTSPQKVGSRAQKDWGSLVVLGRAPINQGTQILEGLGSFPEYTYGGTNPLDDSGVLRYVRLEFGGFEIEIGQEINGLTLGGVGSGTVIDYVEVLHNKDDGYEFFGGTVNASHLLGIAIADDFLDFDFGYTGSVQFAAAIKRAYDEGDSNVLTESDNDGDGSTKTPVTNPSVYNVTAIRPAGATAGQYGGRIRRNSGGQWHNVIVSGTLFAPLFIDGSASLANAASGVLTFDHSILFGDFSDAKFKNSPPNGQPTRDHVFGTWKYNRNTDPMLAIGSPTLVKTLMPDLSPLPGSPALDVTYVGNPPDNGFLVPVDFQGAVGPGDNWILSGWATFSDN